MPPSPQLCNDGGQKSRTERTAERFDRRDLTEAAPPCSITRHLSLPAAAQQGQQSGGRSDQESSMRVRRSKTIAEPSGRLLHNNLSGFINPPLVLPTSQLQHVKATGQAVRHSEPNLTLAQRRSGLFTGLGLRGPLHIDLSVAHQSPASSVSQHRTLQVREDQPNAEGHPTTLSSATQISHHSDDPASSSSKPHLLHLHSDVPSEAIDIPIRPRDRTLPTTPLTARDKGSGQFSYFEITPGKSASKPTLKPKYAWKHINHKENSSTWSRMMGNLEKQGASSTSTRTPSSPLSPSASLISPSSSSVRDPISHDFHAHNIRIPSSRQARVQTAAFPRLGTGPPQSPTKLQNTTLSPLTASTKGHNRPFSDAQRKLHQYQRDLILSASRITNDTAEGAGNNFGGLSSQRPEKPITPHIEPCGSPGAGPATPLLLEEAHDYLTAGNYRAAAAHSSLFSDDERRGMGGMHSLHNSPAVSPAGGRF
ncbi:hypothetical protein MMC25_002421 [Agyrium rufum]|nr:hypothetical protein [Agyrium rufum]